MISETKLQSHLATFKEKRKGDTPFTLNQMAAATQMPIGTVSAICSQAAKMELLTHDGSRPRKYTFVEFVASARPNIDELLDIVVAIETKGIRRSTIAPLLIWIAKALENS